jgi:choline dehydrogenase-like flavoprotein
LTNSIDRSQPPAYWDLWARTPVAAFLDVQFQKVVSAACYSFAAERGMEIERANDVTRFVLEQHQRMSGFLQVPIQLVALMFDFSALLRFSGRFHKLPHHRRRLHLLAWQDSRFQVKRDLVRLFESLAILGSDELPAASAGPIVTNKPSRAAPVGVGDPTSIPRRCNVAVIGSGPGGAVTACMLAEAGVDVLVLEEGPNLALESCVPFTSEEMVQKYRNGGLTVALGSPKIAYVEGRCVGGGSEINSGLYHRTPAEILDRWRREYQVNALEERDLLEHFLACESDISVSRLPGTAPLLSRRLDDGARRLGWRSLEVPRWFRFDGGVDEQGVPTGTRQSMTRTYIPRALAAGARMASGCRVARIRQSGNRWTVVATGPDRRLIEIDAETVFVACGAIQTPALLQRSKVGAHVGQSLFMHPTVKIVAEFEGVVNGLPPGVGVHQVKQFAPSYSFGCSVSSKPYLALAMLDHPENARDIERGWRRMGIYYSMITGTGTGTVRSLPGLKDPLVRYELSGQDMRVLAESLRKLSLGLLTAGAKALYPSLTRGPVIRSADELSKIPSELPRGATNLMTIHLFSSCPMGEDRARCVTDSFGQVHGADNVYIADASLLCTAPGVNPQGSIIAIARRNAQAYLQRAKLGNRITQGQIIDAI